MKREIELNNLKNNLFKLKTINKQEEIISEDIEVEVLKQEIEKLMKENIDLKNILRKNKLSNKEEESENNNIIVLTKHVENEYIE